ncbi:hypothetical protein Plhal304r1_c077g0164321 [Plasmopara halstedii]
MGGAFALILKIVRSQMSHLVRLVAFSIVVIGWLLTFVASSQQLKKRKGNFSVEIKRKCENVKLMWPDWRSPLSV